MCPQHPALYLYTPHLTLLSSQLAEQQGNMKFARAALNRMMNNIVDMAGLMELEEDMDDWEPDNEPASAKQDVHGSPKKAVAA